MVAWIKENQITSILIGAVILLTLMIGYQSNQINELRDYSTFNREIHIQLEDDHRLHVRPPYVDTHHMHASCHASGTSRVCD